jgi:hypothetical protein
MIVGLALCGLIINFYRDNDYVLQESEAVASARQGLAAATEELREASYGADGSYPLLNAATSSVTFYADLNNSGVVDEVTLTYLNGTLYQVVTAPTGSPPTYTGSTSTSTIATYLVNNGSIPVFEFTSSTTALISTSTAVNVANVYAIITTLKVDVDPNRSPAPYTLLSTAALRIIRGQ